MNNNRYMEGECHIMAAALHRNIGTSFLLLCEHTKDYRDPATGKFIPTVHHVYAKYSDGAVLDIRGSHDTDNVKAQWLALGGEQRINPFQIIEVADEKALSRFVDDGWELPLKSYTDIAVNEAWEVFQSTHPTLFGGMPLKK